MFPLHLYLCRVQLAIFRLLVHRTVLFAAVVHIPMELAHLASFVHLDTSVRLLLKFNLAAEEDGVILAERPAMFVVLVFIVHFPPVLTKSHALAASILLLQRFHVPCVLPVVFALRLEARDFHAQPEAFLSLVRPTALYVPLESTPRLLLRLAVLALPAMLVFLHPRARCSVLLVNTVLLGTRRAKRVLQAARVLKPRQLPLLAPPDIIHWATALPALYVPLASTVHLLLSVR